MLFNLWWQISYFFIQNNQIKALKYYIDTDECVVNQRDTFRTWFISGVGPSAKCMYLATCQTKTIFMLKSNLTTYLFNTSYVSVIANMKFRYSMQQE